jgi:hypothetical protein
VEKMNGRQSSEQRPSREPAVSDTDVKPSAFAQVLREVDKEVAAEYEKVQEIDRQRRPKRHAVLPDGTRVALDYAQPPPMQRVAGRSLGQPIDYKMNPRDAAPTSLYDSNQVSQGGGGAYAAICRISEQMRDELLNRCLAQIDPPGDRHSRFRFVAARMCPQCFKGPLIEDEVTTCRLIC